MRIWLLLTFIGISCHQISSSDFDSGQPIQIVSKSNQGFQLYTDALKKILEADPIKDRYVVVVSIAGAYRKGKSFLMSIEIKYLIAQYKRHDISDWLGENSDGNLVGGFRWKSGQERQTTGIWMWSEVFTHDFENGDKVAIILMDTQGIFDDKSSVKECTTIFALSTMLSSVQCYNVMQNIQESDLHHLEFFTEYGRLAAQQSKPFQKLLFIVRDWPNAFETPYGASGQKVIVEFLKDKGEHSPEMRVLRKRIKSSFESIGAFLLPFPGTTVAQGNNFIGDVLEIDAEFRKYVKELMPMLFAPENLIIKQINGQKVRAADLVQYIQTYLKCFNGNSLPKPRTMLEATAEASISIMYNECFKFYIDTMQKYTTLNAREFLKLHQETRTKAIQKFKDMPKLGGDDFAARFLQDLEKNIDNHYKHLEEENDKNRKQKEKFERVQHDLNQAYKRENRGDSNSQFLKTAATTLVATGVHIYSGPVAAIVSGIATYFGFDSFF